MDRIRDIRRALVHELANKVSALKSLVENKSSSLDREIALLVDNLDLLIRYLLDLELPSRKVREKELVLGDVIEDVVSELYLTSRLKDVKVKVEGCNLKINVDEFILKRILYNILHNAIKFSPPNSTVNVFCKKREIFIDNKVDRLTFKELVGSGMGLDITKELASLINVKIEYHNLENLFRAKLAFEN